eukprot:TRINITY_DN2942_c0_g1_i1.p1 TRINITY_DN2942_c0_g1~~TRINITY_DN2942_c0_g1_i1.p1  ORF type:complete len:411 (-),score=70.08 TRINITY_DN2942_c0_g1_i1:690-1922(-)
MSTAKPTRPNAATLKEASEVLQLQEDFYMQLFYRPHTVTLLIVTLYFLFQAAFREDGFVGNTKNGIMAAMFAFLIFCVVQLRDTIFTRPHPAVWRLVTGMAVLYMMALVFFLFQSVDDARQLLKHLYPSLGTPLPERSYAENCDLYTPHDEVSLFRNIWDTLNDEFILAHFFGWWGKTLIIRDVWLCWIVSIQFELLELSFQHMLPNFKECWWDHIIVDILVCNAAGIYLGMQTCKYFEMKTYNWGGLNEVKNPTGFLKRAVLQFTPYSWEPYNWEVFSSFKRFCYVLIFLIVFAFLEVNAFFLKFVLWVPPRNPLNSYRLILWFMFGCPAGREYWQFITDKNCKKFGTMCWLVVGNMLLEVLVIIKYSQGMFPMSHPPAVVWSWTIFVVCLVVWSIYYFVLRSKKPKTA